MINLKKSKAESGDIELSLSDQIRNQLVDRVDPSTVIFFIIKIILIVTPSIGLKVYSINNIKKLNGSLTQLNQELDSRQGDLKKIKNKVRGFDYLKDDAREFNKKKDLVQKLAKNRLKVIKVLDSIQTSLERESEDGGVDNSFIFLERITFNDSKLNMLGVSNHDFRIDDLIQQLVSQKAIYKSIILDNISTEATTNRRNFSITGEVLENI